MKLKARWKRFLENEPGKRFQNEYRRHQAERKTQWSRPLWILVGLTLLAVGLVALPAPGPGMLIVAIGAGLLARESAVIARAMDWLDVKLRALLAWARGFWKDAGGPAKAGLILIGLALGAGVLLVGYYYLIRG